MGQKRPEVPGIFGQAVKKRRQELGLSQEELAWRAEMNRSYVTDVERGVRNLSLVTIDRLAAALEMPLSRLLSYVDLARGIAPARDGREVDILFVEDNSRDVELTLRALNRAGVSNSIHVARDGVEALGYLFCEGEHANRNAHAQPQLILLDLDLPRFHGLELLERLKNDPRTRSIPVVVLTSSDQDRDFAEAKRLRAEAYILKPVDFQRLSKVTPSLNFSWSLQRSNGSKDR